MELKDKDKYFQSLKKICGDKGIKSFIVEKYLPYINERINYYADKFDLGFGFTFDNQFNDLFPNIDNIDIVDLLFFFNLKFASSNDDENKQAVKDIASIYKIDILDDKFDELFIYVNDFINFLKNIQQ